MSQKLLGMQSAGILGEFMELCSDLVYGQSTIAHGVFPFVDYVPQEQSTGYAT